MRKWSFALLLLAGATMLGATVFSQPIAWAAQTVDATIAGPLDNGNVRVHEEGTANVNVTNSRLPVAPPTPIRDGGGAHRTCSGGECGSGVDFIPRATATALAIRMSGGVESLTLGSSSEVAARFLGPAAGVSASIVLPLDRPITFDVIDCHTSSSDEECTVSWVGNAP